ncbi:MAG: hypothetical protein NW200_07225 [Hyphomonadaceae bacterium]|nr:hypothetical protein [Hyphomonadaceae bacterium]
MKLLLTPAQNALLEAIVEVCGDNSATTLDDDLAALAAAHALMLAARGEDELDAVRRAGVAGRTLVAHTFAAFHALHETDAGAAAVGSQAQ